ncbi:sugar nucleotide-binding protein [Lentibacillus cibarius]|uniref:Sugar nucleotide-binding protein n=1 Tax=Lentibacillus cibarius TaxID=2583219 RepID=A0A549YG18_9BACI|nr:sugar nucleotide-binding protein [Lentibacillus cibarius]TMN22048.1 sugar nucleotide-binding protein [Lentibacillus cibarius]TRM10824.1 sugar nucleotide-binding protein [Lentibacillus cibarius]
MKIIVFGASGYAGSAIYQLLKNDPQTEVIGTYLDDPGMFDDLYKLDVNEPESFSAFFKQIQPDAVVWSVMSGPYEDELINEGLLHLINHLSPETKLVYISTDFVFADGYGPYTEDSVITKLPDEHVLSTYANAKVKAERFIRNDLINCVILRAGPIYGKNSLGKRDERTNQLLTSLRQGETTAYRDDLIRTFVHVDDLAAAVKAFAMNELTGVYHAGPNQRASFYSFMRRMAESLGYDKELVQRAEKEELPDKEIPKNTALATEKIVKETNLHFRPLP